MEEVFCQTFTASVPGIGAPLELPLAPGGNAVFVTEDNRREFVDAYVDCLLSKAVHTQFEVEIDPSPALFVSFPFSFFP